MGILSKQTRLLLLALFLGWSANIFFWDTWLGLSVLLFIFLLVIGLRFTLKQRYHTFVRQNLWLLLPLFFFASMVGVRDSSLLTGLNLLATAYFLVLVATFVTAGDATRPGFVEFGMFPIRAGLETVVRPFWLIRETADFESLHNQSRHTVYPVLRGALLATPIFLVFFGLLVSADAIFASTVSKLFTWESTLRFPARGLFSLVMAWFVLGWLLYSVRQKSNLTTPIPKQVLEAVRRNIWLGIKEAATILGSLNLLFGSFVLVQFAYLFGGLQQVSLDGMTYAEYARRGFFELIAVSVLTLGLILLLHWFTERTSGRQTAVFNVMSGLMVGFVVIMLISAFKRLSLYELQFGFTETRLYVHVFMIWLAILLAWFAVALWWQPHRLAIGALVAGVGFLVTMNLLNPDAFVVQQNMNRFHLLGYLDVDYLTTLSNDAVPQLIAMHEEISSLDEVVHADQCWHRGGYSSGGAIGRNYTEVYDMSGTPVSVDNAKFCFETRHPTYLTDHLNGRLHEMSTNEAMWQWQAFQIGRWRAYRALLAWGS